MEAFSLVGTAISVPPSDTIANNLANVSTNGFKRSRAEFQDMFYQEIRAAQAGGPGGGGRGTPAPRAYFAGTQPATHPPRLPTRGCRRVSRYAVLGADRARGSSILFDRQR